MVLDIEAQVEAPYKKIVENHTQVNRKLSRCWKTREKKDVMFLNKIQQVNTAGPRPPSLTVSNVVDTSISKDGDKEADRHPSLPGSKKGEDSRSEEASLGKDSNIQSDRVPSRLGSKGGEDSRSEEASNGMGSSTIAGTPGSISTCGTRRLCDIGFDIMNLREYGINMGFRI
ncbi:hypothetical protein B9Z55_008881 [Caenorhabditis nigoni]|nr:hypothetical protein B9Z55_008881 [Caenorhabditis nigoni]